MAVHAVRQGWLRSAATVGSFPRVLIHRINQPGGDGGKVEEAQEGDDVGQGWCCCGRVY